MPPGTSVWGRVVNRWKGSVLGLGEGRMGDELDKESEQGQQSRHLLYIILSSAPYSITHGFPYFCPLNIWCRSDQTHRAGWGFTRHKFYLALPDKISRKYSLNQSRLLVVSTLYAVQAIYCTHLFCCRSSFQNVSNGPGRQLEVSLSEKNSCSLTLCSAPITFPPAYLDLDQLYPTLFINQCTSTE